MPLPDGYEIKQLADPLYPFSSSVNFFLVAFNSPDMMPENEESKIGRSSAILLEATGSSIQKMPQRVNFSH